MMIRILTLLKLSFPYYVQLQQIHSKFNYDSPDLVHFEAALLQMDHLLEFDAISAINF